MNDERYLLWSLSKETQVMRDPLTTSSEVCASLPRSVTVLQRAFKAFIASTPHQVTSDEAVGREGGDWWKE